MVIVTSRDPLTESEPVVVGRAAKYGCDRELDAAKTLADGVSHIDGTGLVVPEVQTV